LGQILEKLLLDRGTEQGLFGLDRNLRRDYFHRLAGIAYRQNSVCSRMSRRLHDCIFLDRRLKSRLLYRDGVVAWNQVSDVIASCRTALGIPAHAGIYVQDCDAGIGNGRTALIGDRAIDSAQGLRVSMRRRK
jgi:hypothetical protein